MIFSVNKLQWLNLILKERFGCDLKLLLQDNKLLELSLEGSKSSIYFDRLDPIFHNSCSDFPCEYWNPVEEGFKVPIEKKIPAPTSRDLQLPLVEFSDQGAYIHYDILGLIYWMLSRQEEIGRVDLDAHDRFPATASHAFSHGYLERPIVDEWLIVLGQVINQLWPHLKLKQHSFQINVSHDVDSPSLCGFKSWRAVARMMASYLIKQKNFRAFALAPYLKLNTNKKLNTFDPYNTFNWLMDLSEINGFKSAFYFICGNTHKQYDADYDINHPAIRDLLRRIHERGHEIGLHPSYMTYQQPQLIKHEANELRRVCDEEGIVQDEWGGRMHYLRWQPSTTLTGCDLAGMTYDSTLGYADRPGFRCGTCFDYPAFDPVHERLLSVRIRPLIVMECTVIGHSYLNLGASEAAVEKMIFLKDRCKKVSGSFNALWHNSYFFDETFTKIYEYIIKK